MNWDIQAIKNKKIHRNSIKMCNHIRRLNYWERLEYEIYICKGMTSEAALNSKLKRLGFSDVEIELIGLKSCKF